MATHEHESLDLVGSLDPTRNENPPARGSDRYRSILESAMLTDTAMPIAETAPTSRRPAQRHQRRSWRLVAGIAAATLAATGGFVLLRPSDEPTAQAAVSSAANAMGAITSLEGELISLEPGVSEGTTRIRVDGDDVEISGETRYTDGRVERATLTVVGGTVYETIEGETTSAPRGPNDRLAPFGQSSEAVISAALEHSEVTERGEEIVTGVATTRYDLELTDASIVALSALTVHELAWFELEYPDSVRTLSVWVADDLVHQIEIAHRDQVTRTRFFNFNGDITITAPPGPYLESNDN